MIPLLKLVNQSCFPDKKYYKSSYERGYYFLSSEGEINYSTHPPILPAGHSIDLSEFIELDRNPIPHETIQALKTGKSYIHYDGNIENLPKILSLMRQSFTTWRVPAASIKPDTYYHASSQFEGQYVTAWHKPSNMTKLELNPEIVKKTRPRFKQELIDQLTNGEICIKKSKSTKGQKLAQEILGHAFPKDDLPAKGLTSYNYFFRCEQCPHIWTYSSKQPTNQPAYKPKQFLTSYTPKENPIGQVKIESLDEHQTKSVVSFEYREKIHYIEQDGKFSGFSNNLPISVQSLTFNQMQDALKEIAVIYADELSKRIRTQPEPFEFLKHASYADYIMHRDGTTKCYPVHE